MEKPKFTGRWLARWNSSDDLSPNVKNTLQRIADFGCEVMMISADQVTPSFAYTVGIFDVIGAPEIITVGLRQETAHHALNEAFRLMSAGTDLSKGRHKNIVGDVEVEFRPVHQKWLHHIMLRTDWYYDSEDVPVLQMVTPDLQNRFPEDPDFDPAFAQAFLTADFAEHETTANDLWLAYDEASSVSRWKFGDSPHVGVYLSQTVSDHEEAVTYVSHDADGDWQFLGDKMSDGGGPVLSCFHHPIDNDRTLEGLHDLSLNWYAVREHVGAPWERFEHPPREGAEETADQLKDSEVPN